MYRQLSICMFVLCVVACKGETESPAPVPDVTQPTEAAEPVEAGEPSVAEALAPDVDAAEARNADPGMDLGTAPVAETPVEPREPAPARDLAAELRDAIGSPVDCVKDYRPSTAKTIRVNIGGVVRATGVIIEPSASGTGLSQNDRRCIEERVGALVLAPLAGSTSIPVSTYVDVELTPPTVKEYDVAPPPPPAKDVVPSLPKKEPIAPSGQAIEGPAPEPIEGPDGVPIDGPRAVPIQGPRPVPIGSQ